jgi:hypothetical protein
MSDSARLKLPYLSPSQAQKHVTVNEAFARLDALTGLVLESTAQTAPPGVVSDGVCYGVPAGATGVWAGQAGRIAIGSAGGWVFADPALGWRAFIKDQGAEALHDGTGWLAGQATLSPNGAGLALRVVEIDHAVTAGASSVTAAVIPAGALVFGVTARVIIALTGTLTTWQLGNPGAVGRYGSGLGTGAGSFASGLLGTPMAFYAATPLQLDATGGNFAGGTVRLAVHLLTLSLPAP